jgi:hypothetical protein
MLVNGRDSGGEWAGTARTGRCKSWEGAQWLPRPLVPSSFPLSGRAFLPRDLIPSRPASDRLRLSLSSLLSSSHQPSTTSSSPPFPYPFPLPPTVSISFPLCVCVLVDCQFWVCLVKVIRVRVDHLVIDKRMRSGEAGKLNSLRIDSSVPHDNDRYSIPLLSYLLRDNIILFHFFFFLTISFFAALRNSLCRE